jgi:hypothetical protein
MAPRPGRAGAEFELSSTLLDGTPPVSAVNDA